MQTPTSGRDSGMVASTVLPSADIDVDVDLYGRGFDGIFGRGAEEAGRLEALANLKLRRDRAMAASRQRCGTFIERDLYGRGDPRVFGVMPTTNSSQTDHKPVLINTHQQNNVRPLTVAKASRAFLIPAGLLGKISRFSSTHQKGSIETVIPLEYLSSTSSDSSSASSSASPSASPSASSSTSISPLPSPATIAKTVEGSELAQTPTTRQASSTTRTSLENHANRSVPSSSKASKQTSFRRIESSFAQRRSGVDALPRRVRSSRPGETETAVMEQGLVARLVDSLHSSGILSPKSSQCMSNLASYDAYSTADQPTRPELPTLSPQALQNPSPFRNDSANTSDSSSSETANSTTTPSASGSAVSSPRTTPTKTSTSVDHLPLNSLSNLNSPRTSEENQTCSEKATSTHNSSTLPAPLRSATTSSSSTPSRTSSVAIQHPPSSSPTPSSSKLSFGDRSESSPAATSPPSPAFYTVRASSSKPSSSTSQSPTPSSSGSSSPLNSRTAFTPTSRGTGQTSKSSDLVISSSTSNPTTKSSVAAQALSIRPGSADLSDSAPASAPESPAAKRSGRKRLVRVFQRVRSIFRMSRSSSGTSQPSSAVSTDAVRPSFGPSGSEAITSGHEVSRSSSASEGAETVSQSTSTGLDSDGISVSSKEHMSMKSSSSNSRAAIAHSGSHQRLSTPHSIQSQPEGDVLCKDGFEAVPADTQALSDVAGRSPEASIRSQSERGSSGTEKESSSFGLTEQSDDVMPASNSEPESSQSKELRGHDMIESTAPVHPSSALDVNMIFLEQNEGVLANLCPAEIMAVNSLPRTEEADTTSCEFSRRTFVQNSDDHLQDGVEESNDDLDTNKDVSFSSDIEMPDEDALEAALESASSSQFIDSDDSAYAPASSDLRTSSTDDAGPDSDDYSPEEQACSSSMVADVESSVDASFPSFLEMKFLTR